MSITLYENEDSTGCTFTDSEPNLRGKAIYTRATVTAGTWLFYSDPNYNGAKNPEDKKPRYKRVNAGEEKVHINGVNGSMFLVAIDEGLILFEHFNYGGKSKWFQHNQEDLTGLFPSEPPSGVSSAILLSKSRSVVFHTDKGFKGEQKLTLKPGEWREKLGPLHDKLLSFEFI